MVGLSVNRAWSVNIQYVYVRVLCNIVPLWNDNKTYNFKLVPEFVLIFYLYKLKEVTDSCVVCFFSVVSEQTRHLLVLYRRVHWILTIPTILTSSQSIPTTMYYYMVNAAVTLYYLKHWVQRDTQFSSTVLTIQIAFIQLILFTMFASTKCHIYPLVMQLT